MAVTHIDARSSGLGNGPTCNLPTEVDGDMLVAFFAGYNGTVPQDADLTGFTDGERENSSGSLTGAETYYRASTDGTEPSSYTATNRWDSYGEHLAIMSCRGGQLQSSSDAIVFNHGNGGDWGIPAFTVDNDGSMVYAAAISYNSLIDSADFTSNGWTQLANDDGGFFETFYKAYDAGSVSYQSIGPNDTATCVIVIVEPAGGGPQTWTGSTGILELAATSGTFVADQTWTGTTATIELAATSGSFVPGGIVWSGGSAVLELVATSGTFTPGVAVWTGNSAVVELAATSGAFTPGAVVWSGSTGVIELVATSGAFTSAQTWTGTTGVVELAAVSGAFIPGAVVWTGSTGVIELIGTSGSFVSAGAPQTWNGTTGVIELVGYSASLIPLNLRLVTKTNTSITMEWDGVWGATSYEVRRDGVTIFTGITDLTYTDSPLSPSTEYDHEVRARFTP